MTAKEVVEFVRQTIIGGDITAEKNSYLHPQRIKYFISSAFNTIYYNTFKKDPSELDYYARNFTGVLIQYDTVRDVYYSDLPKPIVQFPLGEGIRKIGMLQGKVVNFVPTTIGEADLVNGTILSLMSKEIGYISTDNKRVEYRNFDPYLGIKEVYMSLVIPFTEYAPTDWVSIPSGQDLELVNIVKQLILQRQPEDKQNDNN